MVSGVIAEAESSRGRCMAESRRGSSRPMGLSGERDEHHRLPHSQVVMTSCGFRVVWQRE